MHIKISGTRVLFHGIESFSFDEDACELVVRTVSGKEHRRPVVSKAEADAIADLTIERMAVLQSM